jgi:hypothetical protein
MTLGTMVNAQESLRFKATELQQTAKNLTGTDQGWPLVNRLAIYDPGANAFSLDGRALQLLKRYKASALRRDELRKIFTDEVSNGARSFASAQTALADSLFDAFLHLTVEGKAEACIELIPRLQRAVDAVVKESRKNRIKPAEAKLVEQQGEVEARAGALGTWKKATVGMSLVEEDALRTSKASRARLQYKDGSFISLDPMTIAVVRQSRLDLQTREQTAEIVLTTGSVVASNAGGENAFNGLRLKSGNTVATVRSRNVWAQSDGAEGLTVANFDGIVSVETASGTVNVGPNQGLVIRKGKDPVRVLKLLAAPTWKFSTPDTSIYSEQFRLEWSGVDGAESYQIEMSPNRQFENSVRSFSGTGTVFMANELAVGPNYFRVRAYDSKGIRGSDSRVFTVIRYPDLLAPPLILDNEFNGSVYVAGETYYCSGVTEAGSRLFINQQPVPVGDGGRFSAQIELGSLINRLAFLAIDPSGNRTLENKLIIRMKEEQLFRVAWSVPTRPDGNVKRSDRIGVSGIAYPPLKVSIRTGRQITEADCRTNGEWEVYFNVPSEAKTIEIRFLDRKSGDEVAKRTYLLY